MKIATDCVTCQLNTKLSLNVNFTKLLPVLPAALLVAACGSGGSSAPQGTFDGYFVQGGVNAPVVVDIYEDPLCAGCATLHRDFSETLGEMTTSGYVQLRTHPVAYVSPGSSAAVNAWGCAANQGRAAEFADVIFVNQPPFGQWSEETLVGLGSSAGVPNMSEFSQCVEDGQFSEWVVQSTQQAREAGVKAVPTVSVNGNFLPPGSYTVEGFLDFVRSGGKER